jgi:hypothetical protein
MFGGGNIKEKVFELSRIRLSTWYVMVLEFSTILGSYFIGNTWFFPENILNNVQIS